MSKLSVEEEQRILVYKGKQYDLMCEIFPEMIQLLKDIEEAGLTDDK